jgi:uncharacterized protein
VNTEPSTPVDREAPEVRARLRAALTDALKTRNAVAVSALRSAIAAVDNAETVDAPDALPSDGGSPHVAGTVSGLGAVEVSRRRLSEAEMDAIVQNEIVERHHAALESVLASRKRRRRDSRPMSSSRCAASFRCHPW